MMRLRTRSAIAVAAIAVLLATLVAPAGAADPDPGWTATVGTNGETRYFDADAGPDGSIIVVGWEQTGLETDGVVRKLDANGNQVWKTLIGDDGTADYIRAVDVAGDGSIFVTGQTRGDIGGRTGGTDFDGFVAKLNSAGTVIWTAQFGVNGSNADDFGLAVAADDDGSVFVGASVSYSAFAAVFRFDQNGTEDWSFAYGNAGDIIQDMAFGGDGSAYFVGTGTSDGFIISASAAGTMSSTTRVAGVTSLAAASAPDGDIVVGGDNYLARFGSFGFLEWAKTSVSVDLIDVDVESDDSIVAFAHDSGAPQLRGFTATGTLESWSKSLAAAEEGNVVATDDGGVATTSIDGSFDTVHLARFTNSVDGSGDEFTDVPAGAYYAEAVAWLKAEGITTGTSPTTYSPDQVVTRAQMAAFLHRLVGEPGGNPAHGFSDVPSGTYYSEAVRWLKNEGITTGTSATTYSPGDVVTRAQMAAFLWRLAGEPGGNPAHGFSDVPDGSYYAEAVRWLKAQGITTGTSPTTYAPDDVVTRAQMAAFLFRMATDSDWDYPGD